MNILVFEHIDETMTENTLKIAIQAEETFINEVLMEPEDSADKILSFETMDQFYSDLSQKKLELLRAIAANSPRSIKATAELVGRDKKNVHENLQDLAELGLVEFEDGPYGSKQPIAVYDTLQVQIPIRA